jgi:hypothetical protein
LLIVKAAHNMAAMAAAYAQSQALLPSVFMKKAAAG